MELQELKEVFKKQNKSQDELKLLKAYLSKLQFFEQIFQEQCKPQLIVELISSIRLELYPENSLIFQQNDTICQFGYVILSGSVSVYQMQYAELFDNQRQKEQELKIQEQKANTQEMSEQQKQREELIKNATKKLRTPRENLIMKENIRKYIIAKKMLIENDNSELIQNRNQFIQGIELEEIEIFKSENFGKMIVEMNQGQIFGEIAMMKNQPRKATVIAKTNCELLLLEKKEFQRTVQQQLQNIIDQKNEMLLQIFPFFETLITSAKVFQRIIRLFIEEKLVRKQILIKEGAPFPKNNGRVYVIIEGEVVLQKFVFIKIRHQDNLPKFKKQQITITTLGRGEFIGEEILESQIGQYQYTAMCSTNAALLWWVEKRDIFKNLPDQFKNFIILNWNQKQKIRQSKFQKIQQQKQEIYQFENNENIEEKLNEQMKVRKIMVVTKENNNIVSKQYFDQNNLDSILNETNNEFELQQREYYRKIEKEYMLQRQELQQQRSDGEFLITQSKYNKKYNNNDQQSLDKQNLVQLQQSVEQISTNKLPKIHKMINQQNKDTIQSKSLDNKTHNQTSHFEKTSSTYKHLNTKDKINQNIDEISKQNATNLEQQQKSNQIPENIQGQNEGIHQKFDEAQQQQYLQQLQHVTKNNLSSNAKLVNKFIDGVKNIDPFPFRSRNIENIRDQFQEQQIINNGNRKVNLITVNIGHRFVSPRYDKLIKRIAKSRTPERIRQKEFFQNDFTFIHNRSYEKYDKNQQFQNYSNQKSPKNNNSNQQNNERDISNNQTEQFDSSNFYFQGRNFDYQSQKRNEIKKILKQ